MKKYLIALLCCMFCGVIALHAESSVYLFVKTGNSTTYNAFVDGKKVCDLNGPIKKTMDGGGMFKIPYKVAYPCYRKLVFNTESNVIISIEADFTNCMNLNHTIMKGEIQLDLEDGETYYIDVTSKGMKDIQLKPIPDKKAEKNLSGDKWKELSPMTVEQ